MLKEKCENQPIEAPYIVSGYAHQHFSYDRVFGPPTHQYGDQIKLGRPTHQTSVRH